jgi:hypothetical protein
VVPILSQINPIHIPSYLSKIHFNIVHPPTLGLPSGLLPSGTNYFLWIQNVIVLKALANKVTVYFASLRFVLISYGVYSLVYLL